MQKEPEVFISRSEDIPNIDLLVYCGAPDRRRASVAVRMVCHGDGRIIMSRVEIVVPSQTPTMRKAKVPPVNSAWIYHSECHLVYQDAHISSQLACPT
jgi:hypothetical protein